LLVSSGASVIGPVFRNTSTIIVGYSANLTGGATGSIPYQSNPSTTAMLALGSANQILSVNATGNGLIWTTGIATSTANNLTGGSTNKIPYQTGAGATSFFGPGTDGQVLVSKGTTVGGPVFTDTSQITAGKATNLVGGLKGSLPYQTAVDSTLMLGIGTANQVLTVNSTGDGFIWAAPQSGAASTANNIVGGSSGRLLWQVDVDQTGFTNAGSAGQILISGGTGSPTWSAVGTLSATGGTGGIGLMTVTGEIRATKEITAYYSSDIRLKENVTVIENALEKVKSLSGVMFDWKDDVIENRGGDDNYFVRKHDTGIIAQDVEKVLPEVVAVRDDGFLAVRYEKLAGLIIQAINELAAEVDELKKQIQ
jgi:Chaperone of endosialidase